MFDEFLNKFFESILFGKVINHTSVVSFECMLVSAVSIVSMNISLLQLGKAYSWSFKKLCDYF